MSATINSSLNNDLSSADDIPVQQYTGAVGFTFSQDPTEAYHSYVSSTAQDDELTYNIPPMKPGTYSISILGTKDSNKGIASIYHGGVLVADLDFYEASTTPGVVTAQFIITDGTATQLEIKMESKNASSSGYGARLNRIALSKQPRYIWEYNYFITEAGDNLTTEAGDRLIYTALIEA